MFTTLNNETSRRILMYALNGKYRFVAYSLFNYREFAFTPDVYKRLFTLCFDFLGAKFYDCLLDSSIDVCVRDYLYRYFKYDLCV